MPHKTGAKAFHFRCQTILVGAKTYLVNHLDLLGNHVLVLGSNIPRHFIDIFGHAVVKKEATPESSKSCGRLMMVSGRVELNKARLCEASATGHSVSWGSPVTVRM